MLYSTKLITAEFETDFSSRLIVRVNRDVQEPDLEYIWFRKCITPPSHPGFLFNLDYQFHQGVHKDIYGYLVTLSQNQVNQLAITKASVERVFYQINQGNTEAKGLTIYRDSYEAFKQTFEALARS